MKINEFEVLFPQTQDLNGSKSMQISQIPDGVSIPFQLGQENQQLSISGLLYALTQATSDDIARQFFQLCSNHKLFVWINVERNEGLYGGWYIINNASVSQLPGRFDRPFSANIIKIKNGNLATFVSSNIIELDPIFNIDPIYLIPLPSGVSYTGKTPVLIGGALYTDFLLDADLDASGNSILLLQQPDPNVDDVWDGQCIGEDDIGMIRNTIVNLVGDVIIGNGIIRLKWIASTKKNQIEVFNGMTWDTMGIIEITANGEIAVAQLPILNDISYNEIEALFHYTINAGYILEVIFNLKKANEFFVITIKTGINITIDEIRITNTSSIVRLFNGINENIDPTLPVSFSSITNIGAAETSSGYVGLIYTGQGTDHPNSYPPGDTATSIRWGRTVANETIKKFGLLAISSNSNTHEDNGGTPSDLGAMFHGNAKTELILT